MKKLERFGHFMGGAFLVTTAVVGIAAELPVIVCLPIIGLGGIGIHDAIKGIDRGSDMTEDDYDYLYSEYHLP